MLDEDFFYAGEEIFFVEHSLSIRQMFVDKLFAMCRWTLTILEDFLASHRVILCICNPLWYLKNDVSHIFC